MLSPELKKLKEQLERGGAVNVDNPRLLSELQALDNVKGYIQHSLSLSGFVCPTCGRKV